MNRADEVPWRLQCPLYHNNMLTIPVTENCCLKFIPREGNRKAKGSLKEFGTFGKFAYSLSCQSQMRKSIPISHLGVKYRTGGEERISLALHKDWRQEKA